MNGAEATWEHTPAKRNVRQRQAYPMSVTAAVFHPEISPLNDDAPANMYLQVGRQGWAGRCLQAALPRAAGRQAAVQVRSKISEKQRLIAASISRLSSPSSSRREGEGRKWERERKAGETIHRPTGDMSEQTKGWLGRARSD